MAFPPIGISSYPIRIDPLTNIAPFTYRSGETYLTLLYRLKDYIEELSPQFNQKMGEMIDTLNTGIAGMEQNNASALAAWNNRFDEFIANTAGLIAELNDEAIASLINDPTTDTATALAAYLDTEINQELETWFGAVNPARPPYNVDFSGNEFVQQSPTVIAANTAGMQAALDHGGKIMIPAGFAWVNGNLGIGSYSRVIGAGKGITRFKIAAGTSWNNRVFYFKQGSTRSSIEHLSVDGNIQNRTEAGKMGGIYGTNISVINSTYIKVDSVESVWAAQHCFDVTTPYYGDAGDGAIIPNPSEFVDFVDCYADMHGDDGFTTHGSGHITFTRCRSGGSRKAMEVAYDNGNGFEFDDYSYDITATDCYASGNAHGFEVKAHTNQSAARNVRLIGCVAEYNEVNFSLRHIGHHLAGTPDSLTAKNVQIIGCTSRFPRRVFFGGVDMADGDVPDDQTPAGDTYMAMQIGGYRGVTVNNFHAIGDPTFNYNGAPAIVIHFKAEDVTIDGYHVEGHTTSDWDIYATGGAQPCKNVILANGHHVNSGRGAVSAGGEANIHMSNIKAQRNVVGSPNTGTCYRAYGQKQLTNVTVKSETPWAVNYNISDVLYSSYETPLAANTLL